MMSAIQSPKKLALLIGNNDYEAETKLTCCINDAMDVGNELEKVGFQVTIGIDLTYMKMMQKILQFQRQIDKDDLVVFFFSGHGAQWEDQNYLIPTDNKCLSDDVEMYRHYAIRAQLILESMAKRPPCAIIFLLDCCRDYIIENQALSNMPLKKSVQEETTTTSFTSMKGVAGSMVVFPCGPNGSTLGNSKNGRNSVFTYHLLKHIAEPNLKIDEMMCRVCNGMFEDTDGKSSSFRLSSLRTPNIYFNTLEKDIPLCDLLSVSNSNQKLEQYIEEHEPQSTIDLRNMSLNDDDIEIVVEQATIKKQCKRLNLQNNNITLRGASIIAAALNNNATLQLLNLSNNHLCDMGAKSLSEKLSLNNSVLKLLDLSSNDITDLGAQYLTEILKTNQTLIFLGLSSNQIGDQGVRLLANALAQQNISLQEFYINGNKLVGDLSIDSLVQMFKYNRSLKRFCISHCNLSKKGKKKLRQAARWKVFLSIQT